MFFAGMVLGAMAGTVFGIGLICCVVAGKREDQQMEQMRIRSRMQEGEKRICFPGIGEKEAFSIRDGESLYMIADNGEHHVSVCSYVDKTHVEIDGTLWELSAFVSRMQEIGITYTPFLQK